MENQLIRRSQEIVKICWSYYVLICYPTARSEHYNIELFCIKRAHLLLYVSKFII